MPQDAAAEFAAFSAIFRSVKLMNRLGKSAECAIPGGPFF
jgi:hypothetical protein